MKITIPGLYRNFDTREYLDDPCESPSLSQSICKILIDESPRHAKFAHPRLNPSARRQSEDVDPDATEEKSKYDKKLAIGNAAHKLLLGRGQDLIEADFPDFRTKAARELRDNHPPGILILKKHLDAAQDLSGVIRAQMVQHEAGDLFDRGDAEVVVAWQEDGIWMRCMIDYLSASMLVATDLKTTSGSASPQAVPYLMADAGWDVQAAMQERGLNALHPEDAGRRTFYFVAAEQAEPFGITVNKISESVLSMGRRKIEIAKRIWKDCLEKDEWPGYPPLIFTPEYPGFKQAQWEERELVLMGSKNV